MSHLRRRLVVVFALGLGGCALLRAGVDAGAPGPAGGPRDVVDTGLGVVELLAGGAGALGLGGPLVIALAAAVRRGRALRAVAAGVEAGGDPGTKAAIREAVAGAGAGAGAALDGAIVASCGTGALGRRRGRGARKRSRARI